MPKKATELGPLDVSRLKKVGMHAVGGVAGLCLQVVESGARSWVLRAKVGGGRPKMGLGGYPDVTLAQARELARDARQKIRQGIAPIEERKTQRQELIAKQAKDVTFKDCAERYIEAHSPTWKNKKHVAQWSKTFETYAYPVIGKLWVREVTVEHVMQILEPIWITKTPTASRLRGRIESVLSYAKTRKYRTGENPAAWKDNLKSQLAAPKKVRKVKHHKAVPVASIGSFMKELRQLEGTASAALEFLVLTSVRSRNVRCATWPEIDFVTKTWAIPGEDDVDDDDGDDDNDDDRQRMKGGVAHRVPLSKQAIELLEGLDRHAGTELLFPSPRKTGPLSDMAMNKLMRDMKAGAVPHGMRSTFRDWALEHTNFQSQIAEKALAHVVGDETERAYLRSDAFNKRRRMMQMWADFCDKVQRDAREKVVPIRAA